MGKIIVFAAKKGAKLKIMSIRIHGGHKCVIIINRSQR